MLFKKDELKDQFWLLKPKAKLLMCFANWVSWTLTGKSLFVTMIYYKGGAGVHEDYRAFDSRIKDYYTEDQVNVIMGMVNGAYPYDPRRPEKKSCLRHKVDEKDIGKYQIPGFTPEDHLHFQAWIN